MRGLGAKPLQLLGKAVDLCGLIVQIQRDPGECVSSATPKQGRRGQVPGANGNTPLVQASRESDRIDPLDAKGDDPDALICGG